MEVSSQESPQDLIVDQSSQLNMLLAMQSLNTPAVVPRPARPPNSNKHVMFAVVFIVLAIFGFLSMKSQNAKELTRLQKEIDVIRSLEEKRKQEESVKRLEALLEEQAKLKKIIEEKNETFRFYVMMAIFFALITTVVVLVVWNVKASKAGKISIPAKAHRKPTKREYMEDFRQNSGDQKRRTR